MTNNDPAVEQATVEAVARALCRRAHERIVSDQGKLKRLINNYWHSYIEDASVAVSAMPPLTIDREELAGVFCDAFTGGNEQLAEASQHHREAYLKGADAIIAHLGGR
jgi:hypothetical protein